MEKQKWKEIDALELLQRAEKLHDDIVNLCMSSSLPPAIVIGVLESVKTGIHFMVHIAP